MGSAKSIVWWMLPLILGFFMTSIAVQTQVAVPSQIVTVNPDGAIGTALIVYHPGLSSFQRDVAFAFVSGLASTDWRCDVTTASREAPTDLSSYDLLVLGAPTYAFKPARPITRYLKSLVGLEGLPTALVVTGAGTTARSTSLLLEHVANEYGIPVEVLELWQLAPNEEMYGTSDAMEIAERAGASVALP